MQLIQSTTLLSLLLIAHSGFAHGSEMESCKYELEATNAVLGMRDHGKSKEDLKATLPSREQTAGNPQADLLHSIIDDIYSRTDIAAYPYFHYRGLVCLTEAQGVPVNVTFNEVADQILSCQNKHGADKTEALGNCISATIQ